MYQIKEEDKTQEKELNKMDTSNLPDTEFKTLVIRMLNAVGERVDEICENITMR